jgi:hypothetical protein
MKKARNPLLAAIPHQVERSLTKLGQDLKTARIRRNLSAGEVAQKIGTSRFAALLWTYGFVDRLADIVDPKKDEEGTRLALARSPARAGFRRSLDNEF